MCPDTEPSWLSHSFSFSFFSYKGTSNPLLVISLKPAAPQQVLFQVSSIPKWMLRTCTHSRLSSHHTPLKILKLMADCIINFVSLTGL